MKPVVMYSTRWCPDCRRAKNYLRDRGVDFEEIDIEQDPAAAELVISKNGGKRRVPTLQIDGRFFGNPGPLELERILREAGLTT